MFALGEEQRAHVLCKSLLSWSTEVLGLPALRWCQILMHISYFCCAPILPVMLCLFCLLRCFVDTGKES